MLEIRVRESLFSRRQASDTCGVANVDLDVPDGTVLALLGPSGCGKSTLLRAIAGLEPVAAGEIRWDGTDLAGIPVHRRGFGLMFQDGVLFPHRDVAGNIAYGLRRAGLRGAARSTPGSADLLELVGLPGLRVPAGGDALRRRGAAGGAGPRAGPATAAVVARRAAGRTGPVAARAAAGRSAGGAHARPGPRRFSSPTTRARPSPSRTGWPCCGPGSVRQIGAGAGDLDPPGGRLGGGVRRLLRPCWTRRCRRVRLGARARPGQRLGLRPAALVLDPGGPLAAG